MTRDETPAGQVKLIGNRIHTRRQLLALLGATAFAPRSLLAESKRPPVLLGWLNAAARESDAHNLAVFKEGLAALGWKEGAQFVIEEHWAGGRHSRMQSLAKELAAKNPVVIIAAPLVGATFAAKVAPGTPIVMASGGDPVATGLVKSLAHPGGMMTGIASLPPAPR